MRRQLREAAILFAAILAIGMTGCASFKAKTIEDQKASLAMWTDFAKQNRLMLIVQASHDGRVSLFEEASVGLDAGSVVTATFLYDPDKGASTLGGQP